MRAVALSLAVVVYLAPGPGAAETTSYQYDALGRLTGSTLNHGTVTSTSIGYDAADNRSSYQVGISGGSSPMRAAMTSQSAAAAPAATSSTTPRAGPGIIAPSLSKFKKPAAK